MTIPTNKDDTIEENRAEISDEDDGDLQSDPLNAPNITKTKGDELFRRGEYEKALKKYSKSLFAINILARGGTINSKQIVENYA